MSFIHLGFTNAAARDGIEEDSGYADSPLAILMKGSKGHGSDNVIKEDAARAVTVMGTDKNYGVDVELKRWRPVARIERVTVVTSMGVKRLPHIPSMGYLVVTVTLFSFFLCVWVGGSGKGACE